ncbi:MAG: hypothetical protein D6750_09515 [Bacteroidetes bacterium]|nr:MAG: hypothetical protein D6750_09515 [Bacteroidota bacterium]
MQRALLLLFPLLFSQTRLRLGKGVVPEKGLVGVDSVFFLQGPSVYAIAEARFTTPTEWDTLWVAVRSPEKLEGIFVLSRTPADRRVYRGRLTFRKPGIYLLLLLPPRQGRLILGRSRAYITSKEFPTLASLRLRHRQIASAAGERSAEAALTQVDPQALELLDLPEEPLSSEGSLPEEPLPVEELDSFMEEPLDELTPPEEEIELDDLNLDDL